MYILGQIFADGYPPEVAMWCNSNGAIIVSVDGGYEIQAAPAPTVDEFFAALRAERGNRLTATDKMLLPDYPISADDLALVKVYRAALRDLPDQSGAPWDGGGEATPWPAAPSITQMYQPCA